MVTRTITLFQSLFFWNSPSDYSRSGNALQRKHVSILVFLELAFGQRGTHHDEHREGVSILVFLELAFGPYVTPAWASVTPSFNPCFFGTRLRTAPWPPFALIILRFNPCFFGTRLRTYLYSPYAISTVSFPWKTT